jgi:hypothetical protein
MGGLEETGNRRFAPYLHDHYVRAEPVYGGDPQSNAGYPS